MSGGVGLFHQTATDRIREHSPSCARGDTGWILGKSFSQERVIKYWNGLPREVVESPSLDVFKKRLVVALGAMV